MQASFSTQTRKSEKFFFVPIAHWSKNCFDVYFQRNEIDYSIRLPNIIAKNLEQILLCVKYGSVT